jgi:hypothetical protein
MNKHTITLTGGGGAELRVSAQLLVDTLQALTEGARLAARFVVEGESARKGARPAWLDAACRFDVTGIKPGSVVLEIEAPTLLEAAPGRFSTEHQGVLFQEPSRWEHKTAIDLFGGILGDLLGGSSEQARVDRALLGACARFAGIVGPGFEGIKLDGIAGLAGPLFLSRAHAPVLEELLRQTPASHAARLVGTLDTISYTRAEFLLGLQNGDSVQARQERHDPAALRRLFGERVVASGVLHYRPSGKPLYMEVESLQPARDADALFGELPWVARAELPFTQGTGEGPLAVEAAWPGEESEEELWRALKELG